MQEVCPNFSHVEISYWRVTSGGAKSSRSLDFGRSAGKLCAAHRNNLSVVTLKDYLVVSNYRVRIVNLKDLDIPFGGKWLVFVFLIRKPTRKLLFGSATIHFFGHVFGNVGVLRNGL
jgi:hypothetical protein